MKKFISLIMAICLMFSITCIPSAADNDSNVFYYGEKEIIVENSELSYDEMKAIADYIAGESNVSTQGLTCTLFGHKITEASVTEITHNVYTTAPKCVERVYDVSSCDRCDYITKTLISTTRVYCH